MSVAQSITLENDKVVMLVTDEPEAVGRIKLHRTLILLFAELCFRNANQKFVCEGCENHWPSQTDHECCMKSEYDIFADHYDDVKNDTDLNMLGELGALFAQLVDVPMSSDIHKFIEELPQESSKSIYLFRQEMDDSWEWGDFVTMRCVQMMCDTLQNNIPWKSEIFEEFEEFMLQ